MSGAADRITASEEDVLNLADTAAQFTSRVPRLSFQLDEVVRALSDANASASQISIANRQIVLADRMSRRVTEIVAGGENTVSAADALSRDATVFAQVLQGFKEGNAELGVAQITTPAGLAALEAVEKLYAEAQADLDVVLGASADLAEVQSAATQISEESKRGEKFSPPLDDDQLAFYDAVASNESAVLEQGDDVLAQIARELVAIMRRDVRTDWTVREDVRAKLRSSIKRLLVKYKYPPDKQPGAIKLVMEQMEQLAPRYAHAM